MHSLHAAWLLEDAPRIMRKHRHVLLAPLFFAVTALMLRSASLQGAVLPAMPSGSDAIQALAGGNFVPDAATGYQLHEGLLQLQHGGVAVVAGGLVHVQLAQSGSLATWNGGVAVLQEHGDLTVAAITAPAVVRFGSGVALVPVGMQWTTDVSIAGTGGVVEQGILSDLPEQYIQQQTKRLASLSTVKHTLPQVQEPTVDSVLKGQHIPDEQLAEQQRIHALTVAVRLSDVATAQSLVGAYGAQLFAGRDGQLLLSTLLSLSPSDSAMGVLLRGFVADADLRLLFALHPLSREEGFVDFDGAAADHRALLLLFPRIDVLPDAMPQWIMARWQRDMGTSITQANEPLEALDAAFTAVASAAQTMKEHGFVDRLQRYTMAAESFARPYAPLLTDERKAVLAAIVALRSPDPVVEQEVPAPESKPEPLLPDQAKALEGQVRDVLIDHGAMLTKDTTFMASTAHAVRVDGVVFATAKGDEVFSFIMDPATNRLTDIVRSGAEQTYGVDIEAFLRWIAK